MPLDPNQPIDIDSINFHEGNKYTSWDGGQSYHYDPNTHFMYNNQDYYVLEGEDRTNIDLWKTDTMSGGHISIQDYTADQVRRQALEETRKHNRRM